MDFRFRGNDRVGEVAWISALRVLRAMACAGMTRHGEAFFSAAVFGILWASKFDVTHFCFYEATKFEIYRF